MSIYFMHLFLEGFILSFFMAYRCKNTSVYRILLSAFVGFIFGYISFYIFNYEKQNQIALLVADFILIITLVLALIPKFQPISLLSIFLLGFATAMRYFSISLPFPVFESSLLDTEGIYNFAFILLAIVICAIFFINFLFVRRNVKNIFINIIALILALMYINDGLAELFLYGLKTNSLGALNDSSEVLSYISKSKYYIEFYYYVCLILSIIFTSLALKTRPQYREKQNDFDIEFRLNNAKTKTININFATNFIICVVSLLVFLYFDLIASKPISIDKAKILTPNADKMFEFNLKEVTDNKLHRFAYITNSGKKVRFFIINRFKDKITPAVVFDACMICGDLGYVLEDDKLICVACNVRIFLPSVGKKGGCNPIPIDNFIVDEVNNKLKIPLREIKNGENYFSEVVEIEVTDPVNKSKFLNSDAKKSYMYKGINYYFNSDESYEEFKKDPSKYVSDSAPFRLNTYNS